MNSSLSLRSPGDVVAVLPYQLGYHPHDSLVVVALRDRAVVLVERIDLPAVADVDEASAVLLPPLLREEPDAVLLVAYETRVGEGRPALEAVRRRLARAGLEVLDRLVVRDGRWFAVDCVTGCCPVEGSPVPSPADTPAVAEFVGLGVAPLPARDALAAVVAADPDRTPAVTAALEARSARAGGLGLMARRFEALSTWAVVLGLRGDRDGLGGDGRVGDGRDSGGGGAGGAGDGPGGGEGVAARTGEGLRPDQVALLVESLRDVQLRDALVAWLCPGSLPPDCLAPDVADAVRTCLPAPGWAGGRDGGAGGGAGGRGGGGRGARGGGRGRRGRLAFPGSDPTLSGRRHLRRLQHLVGAVPDEHAAAMLTVLANLAWWLGDGALARTCLERALRASPDYRLALLLEQMLDLGVRPGGSRGLWPDDAWAG
jgi:hypothetical protein